MDEGRTWRLLSPPVVGWVLYDFANTIFSFVVVTRYFNDWIIEERGQPDIYVGLMVAAVSVALVVSLPLIGAIADRRRRHKPILVAFTLVCVAATGMLGVVESVVLALVIGAVATYAFNTSDSQYHPLLSTVAPEPSRARVSGIGVAIGYVGSLTVLVLIGGIATDGHAQRAFVPAAALFLVFALPLFLLVREPAGPEGSTQPAGPEDSTPPAGTEDRTDPAGSDGRTSVAGSPLGARSADSPTGIEPAGVGSCAVPPGAGAIPPPADAGGGAAHGDPSGPAQVGPFAQLAATLRRARHQPHGRLLLARFFYVDAIATVLQFMTVYARRTGDFDGGDIDLLLAIATVAAIGGAIGAGLLAERIGPRRVVLGTLAITVTALAIGATTGSSALLWVLGPLIGIALGSLSAVDRVLLLGLVPPERRGEDFALYALVGKLSTGFGPLVLWGGTILVMTELAGLSKLAASRVAIGVLAASALVGYCILRPLPDCVPERAHPDVPAH